MYKVLPPALAALLLCSSIAAAPAAWHLWRSKRSGASVCTQVSPGAGWELADGPFRDARCRQRGKPGD